MQPETASHARAKGGFLVLVLINFVFFCFHGQLGSPTFLLLWRRLKIYGRRARFVLGACPTLKSAIWRNSSAFHAAIAARLIRSFTTSVTAAVSTTCYHGASNTPCR